MESDFEFEYQMSLRLVHKLLSKVDERKCTDDVSALAGHF